MSDRERILGRVRRVASQVRPPPDRYRSPLPEPTWEAFAARLEDQDEDCMLPIDSGRHVYTNWEAIMEKRGSYHPALDAFKRPENQGSKARYEPDMCPRTLEILSRTVFLSIRPQTTAAEARKRIRAIERAAEGVR